jgi:glycosyltransferase involved in cell wall biosynthesis
MIGASSRPPTASKLPRYALITPVRDEGKFIGAMIDSILAQSVHPAKWVIVDDGSTDRTPAIIASYAKRADFIDFVRLPAREQREAGGEGAVPNALKRVNASDFDFLARFDADLLFEPDYIECILSEFDRDPALGIAGGGIYDQRKGGLELEKGPEYHVRGALKMYRRRCFEDIGGLTAQIGWDTIDEVYAWTKGWKTRSFFQYKVIHRRPTGEGIPANRVSWERGRAEYLTWSTPLFVLLKAAKIAAAQFSPLRPSHYLAGFVSCYLSGEPRLQDSVFAKARRSQQWRRMVPFLKARAFGRNGPFPTGIEGSTF